MPAEMKTAKHQLLDLLLQAAVKADLATYVAEQRAAGITGRHISYAIRDLTGETITEQSLINWGVL
jgi:hypothetical protein